MNVKRIKTNRILTPSAAAAKAIPGGLPASSLARYYWGRTRTRMAQGILVVPRNLSCKWWASLAEAALTVD